MMTCFRTIRVIPNISAICDEKNNNNLTYLEERYVIPNIKCVYDKSNNNDIACSCGTNYMPHLTTVLNERYDNND